MPMIDWYLEGREYGNCNCDYSCPCQFESLPTNGHCQAFGVTRVDKGHFGDVRLDGLAFAAAYAFPGPVFEGGGSMQAIIDKRADPRQREALLKILYGEETVEGGNHWWVYRAMSDTVHDPLFEEIEAEIDIEARIAKVRIAGLIESEGRPIKSPHSGRDHRVRIEQPHGIECQIIEVGSAWTRCDAAVPITLNDTYGQFNHVRQTGRGPVRP